MSTQTPTKHTDGPWHVEGNSIYDGPDAETRRIVAWSTIYISSRPDQFSDGGANARLIGKAPELLKALEDAIEEIEHWAAYAPAHFRDKYDLAGELAKYRALIVAAKGGAV